MNHQNSSHSVFRFIRQHQVRPRHLKYVRYPVAGAAAVLAFSLVAIAAIAPPSEASAAANLKAYIHENAQALRMTPASNYAVVKRDGYSGTPGQVTLAASGTNYDWAKIILLDGGWPVTTDSVTAIVRWMRQENGTNDWWNRNNPLNNGWGSGGGSGLGSNASLEIAAQNVVGMLNGNPQMAPIVAALASSAPSSTIEAAIWASPWASSHYGNGANWHYTPVDSVKAPSGW
jgi:hypothetical protein